jgi:hypothetical protein
MRGLLAALLALLLVVVTTSDRLVCPDGCVDESPVQATAAPCALCQGWSPSVAVLTPRPLPTVIALEASRAMRPLAPTRPALERPPKSA